MKPRAEALAEWQTHDETSAAWPRDLSWARADRLAW
jgi:hypothetical protein